MAELESPWRRLLEDDMKVVTSVLILLLSSLIGAPASAQLGLVNPQPPPTLAPIVLPPTYPPVSQPHPLHNAHPMQPNAGVITTGGLGVPIRQIWMPPQSVPVEVLVPKTETEAERWDTQSTEIPGYYYTETTLGYIYPERWALYSPEKGLYEWQRVPWAFQPK